MVHPGQRADIHADAGCVGHHVDPLPALEGPHVHRRRAHHRMRRLGEVERLQLRHRPRRLVDRIHSELRHRAMRRHPAEPGVKLERALVADVRIVRRGLAHDHRPRASEQLRLCQVVGADAPALLRRREHQDDSRRAGKFLCKAFCGEQHRRDARLHVGRPPSVQPIAPRFARERIARPGVGAERHDVEVAGEAQRRFRRRSPCASDHARSGLGVLVVLDAKAPIREQRADMPRAVALAAGRIDRLEAQQRARQGDGVVFAHANR